MIDESHYRKLERMYLHSNVNIHIYESSKINIGEGIAEVSLQVDSKYFHALSAMHGSVYFRLLDDAAFFAVNSIVLDVFVLTTNFNINLMRPVSEGRITANGKIRFKSKSLFMAESVLTDEAGKEVAFGSGHFARSKVALTEEIGYHL